MSTPTQRIVFISLCAFLLLGGGLLTGNVTVTDLSLAEREGFIALCTQAGCSSLPLTQYIGGEQAVLGIQKPAGSEEGEAVFGYHFVAPLVDAPPAQAVAGTVKLPYPAGRVLSLGVAGEGIEPITDVSRVITTVPSDREGVFQLLRALQLLVPQASWIDILSGREELKGISLGTLSPTLRTQLLTSVFGSVPSDGAVARFSTSFANYTALYRVLPSGPTLYVLMSRPGAVTYSPAYLVPFIQRDVGVPVPAGVCLNGVVEAGEQCDIGTGLLENHPSCAQSTSALVAGATGTRDGFGSCSLTCQCVYDAFVFTAAAPLGTQCQGANDCDVEREQCVGGTCRPKTYCGDGVVQGRNDDGQREQCDPAAPNPLATIGWLNVGSCTPSIARCTDQCTYAPDLLGGTLPDLLERCGDGIDNNCNGFINEGCACVPGATKACGSVVGQCLQGTQTCEPDGGWSTCQGERRPSRELCDGVDNNCNGIIDDGLLNRAGACGGTFVQEVCDLRDNDGDGLIDEEGVCTTTLSATPQTQVVRAEQAEGPFTLVASLVAGTKTFTDTSAEPNRTYYYQLREYINGSYRTSESTVIRTPPAPVPALPTGVVAQFVGTDVQVRWEHVSGRVPATGFSVYRALEVGALTRIGGTPGGVLTYRDTPTGGSSYSYAVRAENSAGASNLSERVQVRVPARQVLTSGSWTVPAGVTLLTVEVWGGGGRGGQDANHPNLACPGSGGGSGSYAQSVVTVTPGQTLPVVVGSGGGTADAPANGAGGESSLGEVRAPGGRPGLGSSNGFYFVSGVGLKDVRTNTLYKVLEGGSGGTGARGTTVSVGTSGSAGGLCAGVAGATPDGGSGGQALVGLSGFSAGAGGTGNTVRQSNAGVGEAGMVVVWY